ncbi:outer membrane beta-barrel protein [Mesorhizobium sp. CAU 1741]|uniref:outer membrane protein n=1 Tax=Mesorhizobium sp. CAU 1741 TaxID=3140366 RepID=UPI00325C120B
MKRILVALAATLTAGTAMAADVTYMEPTPAAPMQAMPADGWAGLYLGGQIGYGFGSTGLYVLDRNRDGEFGDYLPAFDPAVNPAAGGFTGDFEDGFIGGVHIGYDWQAGNLVYGVLADLNFADLTDQQTGFSATPAFYTVERELDYLATLRGRIGYAFSDTMLAYATGGLAYGDVETRFLTNTPAAFVVSGGQDSDWGYTVGAGLETKVTSNISFGLEYLYTNLGGNDFNVNLSGAAGTGAGNAFGTGGANSTDSRGSDDDFDFHTISAKISYRF